MAVHMELISVYLFFCLVCILFYNRHAMFKLFGISVAFVATRSGLLRWQDINTIDDK